MSNDICVLMLPESSIEKCLNEKPYQVNFQSNILASSSTGKQKKGACRIHAGDIVCSMNSGSSSVQFVSPIGGKVLEINENIVRCPSLLYSAHHGRGYIAVVFPESEIPSIDGCTNYESLAKKLSLQRANFKLCIAFQQGTCTRGDSCKFIHEFMKT